MTNINKKEPVVRFDGFTDAWEQRKLEEISEKVTEKNKNNEFTETFTNSAEYGIINQREFFNKNISNEKNLNGYYIVREDDFIYNPRISNLAAVGPIKRNKLGRIGVMSPLYYVFRTMNIENTYLEYYFNTTKWHRFMELNGDSGARADRFAIKDSVLKTMPIPYPNIEEQTKIGQFFKLLDETITLQECELVLLKEQKKGLLQKMFPKNSSKIPEIRFSGFTDDWEQRKLSDFLTEFSVKSKVENEYLVLSSTNNGMEIRTGRVSGQSNIGYKVVKNGDLVLSPQNLWLGNININDIGVGLVSPSYKTFKLKSVDSYFIKPQLKTAKILDEYKNSSTQGASVVRRNLEIESFYEINMKIPIQEEQIKIGNFFKQLDETIMLKERKLEILKNMKKSFLQKMFV